MVEQHGWTDETEMGSPGKGGEDDMVSWQKFMRSSQEATLFSLEGVPSLQDGRVHSVLSDGCSS